MRIVQSLKQMALMAGFLGSVALLPAQTAKVHGVLSENGEPMPGERVSLMQNGAFKKGVVTDAKGHYEFALLDAGDYTLEVSLNDLFYRYSVTLAPTETEPKALELNDAMVFDAKGERVYAVGQTDIVDYAEKREIFSLDPNHVDVVPRSDIEKAAGPRGLESAIPLLGGRVYQADQGDPLNIGGQRENGTAVYVDGVKVRGDFDVAQASISQIALMNNGVPAEFGDATGGFIVITTDNPGMKAFPGKPMSKAERKALKARMKRGGSESHGARVIMTS